MAALGFLNQSNTPTEEAKAVLPTDLENLSQDFVDKAVFFTISKCFKAMLTKAATGVKRHNHYET